MGHQVNRDAPAGRSPAARLPRDGWLATTEVRLRQLVGRVRRVGFLTPAALTAYLLAKGWHPDLPGWSCPLRALTGIPCPTCFLTRATAAALSGQVAEAVRLHAFGPLLAGLLLIWSVLAIRRRRFLPVTIRGRSLIAAVLALLAYWLVRLVLQLGFAVAAFPSGPGGVALP